MKSKKTGVAPTSTDSAAATELASREEYTLSDYGKGSKKKKKDRAIREKFPDAEIHTLIAKEKLTKKERVIDNLLGFFTDVPFGTPDFIHSCKNLDKEFYLVELDNEQLLVVITDEYIETRRIKEPIIKDKFELDNMKFIKCKYKLKEKK